jgi:hypothetical protein
VKGSTVGKFKEPPGTPGGQKPIFGGGAYVVMFPSPTLFNEPKRIIDLAIEHQLATMAMSKEFVELGGLASCGADITTSIRSAAI